MKMRFGNIALFLLGIAFVTIESPRLSTILSIPGTLCIVILVQDVARFDLDGKAYHSLTGALGVQTN